MEKKSVASIIIDRFLRDVDEKQTMPWQRPYERYNSFNYFTKVPYRGINRLLLPFGEYITRNQITKYNKEKGYIDCDEKGRVVSIKPEAYRFQKGIMWFPVMFFKKEKQVISSGEVMELFSDKTIDTSKDFVYIGSNNGYIYRYIKGKFVKEKRILRYYEVADRKFFKNANGECLPSRCESGEVVITKQEPSAVLNNYVKRQGIKLDDTYAGTPCYIPELDMICLNPYMKKEDSWFSTAFHECGHSTGAENRLGRPGVVNISKKDDLNQRAIEECIAEICACLCCAETGVISENSFKTSETSAYANNVAYVQAWKQRIKDWGRDFIYIVAQADKAFNYICNNPDSSIEGSNEEV